MPRAVVTGGAGFVGSHLCDALRARDWEVVAVDNFVTGRRANLDFVDALPAETRSRYTFVEADIRDQDAMDEVFDGAYGVLHQAALPSVARSVHEPAEAQSDLGPIRSGRQILRVAESAGFG